MNQSAKLKKKFSTPDHIAMIFRKFQDYYGQPETPLKHTTNEQLAIAVVLSAQTTDDQVNKITPELFRYYPDMASLAQADLTHLEKLVFSTGFYKNKAKNIKNLAVQVCENFQGKIPADFNQLLELPGIGRKTANVIMDCAFNTSVGFVVDTHVKRLAGRLGWTKEKNPEKIERDLMEIIPKEYWRDLSLFLIYHGRKFCRARKPDCQGCIINQECPSAFKWNK